MSYPQFLKSSLWLLLLLLASALIVFRANARESSRTPEPRLALGYEGFYDYLDCNRTGGWVWDKNIPGTCLNVSFYDEATGALIATEVADQFRNNLANAGKGEGKYGFCIPTPDGIRDCQTNSLGIKIAGTRFNLAAPKNFESVSLSGLSFITGLWRADWSGGIGEEQWSAASGDSMWHLPFCERWKRSIL